MECDICQHKFNDSNFKPMVIIPCCHTICSQCLTKWQETEQTCPNCRGLIQGTNVNWSLLKIVPEEDPTELELRTIALEQFAAAENSQKEFDKHLSIKQNHIQKLNTTLQNQLCRNYSKVIKQATGIYIYILL